MAINQLEYLKMLFRNPQALRFLNLVDPSDWASNYYLEEHTVLSETNCQFVGCVKLHVHNLKIGSQLHKTIKLTRHMLKPSEQADILRCYIVWRESSGMWFKSAVQHFNRLGSKFLH